MNAVIHRNYTDGSDIQIKIFDDHITIYSPGLLYGGLKLEELQLDNYKSRLRNKLVAEAFYLTGNIEKYGSGFIRIRKAMSDYPELSFGVQEISGGVELTFAQKLTLQPESTDITGQVNGQVTGQVTGQVSPEVASILGTLKGEMSRQQLQEAMSLTSRNNFDKRYLKPALELKLIELTIPDKPNSRLQKYRLTQAGETQLLCLHASQLSKQ